jgi:hypothetical protein
MLFRKHAGAFVVAAAVIIGGAFGLHRAAASQGERRGRERWEHCAVVVSGTVLTEGEKRTRSAYVCYFRGGAAGRCEEVRVPFTAGGDGSSEAGKLMTASSVISRLGMEGWQMVGQGAAETFGVTGEGPALYFKRAVD